MWATALQVGAAIAAFVSAGLWFWSARIVVPPVTGRFGPSIDRLEPSTPHIDALNRQGRINAWAAIAAGASVALQGVLMLLPLFQAAPSP